MYLRPATVDEALAALAARPLAVLAGGTDFYPARVGRPVVEDVLDVSRLTELRGIRDEGSHWRIGALTTWSDVARADLPPLFRGLQQAAREVGGRQIQNAGTVAGNLCNASPAADGAPPLMALGAQVELARFGARRTVPLSDFILGNRRTARGADELATAILVPAWARQAGHSARSAFLKLGARRYLVISIAMVAATLEVSPTGKITRCGIAVGACSPVAKRLTALEKRLLGERLTAGIAALAAPAHLAELAPIDDVRAAAQYRREAALELVRRALAALAAEAGAGRDWS
ncbi:MAG: FAD binding domain-containing protein [Burkholderiales bacterium]|nr:FAD binding domain-containing protein [Burkholderiales bacterium]